MADDMLIAELRRWGIATASRFAYQRDGRGTGDSVLSKTFQVPNGKKVERELVRRDGSDRRELMARRAGVKGLAILPMWACDPVRAANDADPPHEREPVHIDVGIPDDLSWIDRALSQMSRQHPVRALCIREEYTGQGTQRMKAARVERIYGGTLTVRQYRYELQRGLDWMRGSIAA